MSATTPKLTKTSTRLKRIAVILVLVAVIAGVSATVVHAEAEDILVGAFDKITGVPVMTAMLEVVRSGERSSQSPDALDQRLLKVEAMLQAMDGRLRLVEVKVGQLQNELVKLANINRLRELQRLRAEIAAINAELMTHPADPNRLLILEFRAHQQADLVKNNVDFDIWKWSDIDPASQFIRTRFRMLPSFELYGLALTTWFSAIEMRSGSTPMRVVTESQAALREHAAFLRLRDGWLRTGAPSDPLTLREHLYVAAFCRLEAVETFADHSGNCPFAVVCIDEMEDKSTETDRVTLTMQPPKVGTLCTYNPDLNWSLTGEDELRAEHGELLMTGFEGALDRLATSGSLREPFIGQFPDSFHGPIFSVPLDRPLQAQRGAAPGVVPATASCLSFRGCVLGPDSDEAHWTIVGTTPVTIRHDGSNLCLDVKDNTRSAGTPLVLWSCNGSLTQQWVRRWLTNQHYALATPVGGLCATVAPAPAPGEVRIDQSRTLSLEPCDGRERQTFSDSDSQIPGPH